MQQGLFLSSSHAEVVGLSCLFSFNVRLEDLILDKMELPKNVRKKKETLCKDLEPVDRPLFLGIQPSERRPFHSNQNKQPGHQRVPGERYVLRGSSQDSFQWLIGPPWWIVVEVPFFWDQGLPSPSETWSP